MVMAMIMMECKQISEQKMEVIKAMLKEDAIQSGTFPAAAILWKYRGKPGKLDDLDPY